CSCGDFDVVDRGGGFWDGLAVQFESLNMKLDRLGNQPAYLFDRISHGDAARKVRGIGAVARRAALDDNCISLRSHLSPALSFNVPGGMSVASLPASRFPNQLLREWPNLP